MCFELLDTETDSRNVSENEEDEESKDDKQQALEAYVARFLGPGEPMALRTTQPKPDTRQTKLTVNRSPTLTKLPTEHLPSSP